MVSRKAALSVLVFILFIVGVWQTGEPSPAQAAGGTTDDEALASQVQALQPTSLLMVDKALSVLDRGLAGMSGDEQEVYLLIFDPAQTGDIDEAFVKETAENYRLIRQTLAADLDVRDGAGSSMCIGQRLYYTDRVHIFVCPYFQTEENEYRKARTLIHEATHIALQVGDKEYYRPTSKAYKTLTPRGTMTPQQAANSAAFRAEIQGDTLYNPDSYAHFSLAVSGLPGSEKYLSQGTAVSAAP